MKIKNIFIFSLSLLSLINLNADIRNNISFIKISDSKIIEEYGNIKFIKVSPDNKYSVSCHSKEIKYKPVGFIFIREGSSSKIISIINYPGDYISVSNKYIASANQNDEVFLWDIATGNLIRKFGEFKKNDDLIFNNMAEITRNEKYIIGLLGEIFVWEIETGKLVKKIKVSDFSFSFIVDPAGEFIFIPKRGKIEIYSIDKGGLEKEINTFMSYPSYFTKDGKYFFMNIPIDKDLEKIMILDLKTFNKIRALKDSFYFKKKPFYLDNGIFIDDPSLIAMSRDEKYIIEADYNGRFNIWEYKTGEHLFQINTFRKIFNIHFTWDNDLVIFCEDNMIKVKFNTIKELKDSFLYVCHPQLMESWTTDEINSANTADSADYLYEEEKRVVLLVNLVRAYPDKFAKSFVDYYYNVYLKGDFNKESIYYKSLYEDLKKAKSTGALYPSKKLSDAALFHAKDSWKNFLIGHVSSDGTGMFERIDRYADGDMFGENCYYGLGDPFIIVLALLIDEGVPDFGHRYNMLSKDWKSIGISIFDYNPNYGEICVQDFSDIIEK